MVPSLRHSGSRTALAAARTRPGAAGPTSSRHQSGLETPAPAVAGPAVTVAIARTVHRLSQDWGQHARRRAGWRSCPVVADSTRRPKAAPRLGHGPAPGPRCWLGMGWTDQHSPHQCTAGERRSRHLVLHPGAPGAGPSDRSSDCCQEVRTVGGPVGTGPPRRATPVAIVFSPHCNYKKVILRNRDDHPDPVVVMTDRSLWWDTSVGYTT